MGDNKPFLTIVTRCCQRPKMLTFAINTVLKQTCKDIDQIFILDFKRRGVWWSNKQFAVNSHRHDGLYTMTLDDDSSIVNKKFVQNIKAFADSFDEPPGVIMVKAHRPQLKPHILPKPSVWGKRGKMVVASTNGGCYVVRTDWWQKHAKKYGRKAGGDWGFLQALRDNKNVTFQWYDTISRRAQQLGRGRKFEVASGRLWWNIIVKRFGIVEVSKNDWRLQHYKK